MLKTLLVGLLAWIALSSGWLQQVYSTGLSVWSHAQGTLQQPLATLQRPLITLQQSLVADTQVLQTFLQTGKWDARPLQQTVGDLQSTLRVVQDLAEQQWLARHHIRQLPQVGQSSRQANAGIAVIAGDAGVSPGWVNDSLQMVNQISLGIIYTNVHLQPRGAQIVLFSTSQAYAQALQKTGLANNEVNSIVENTGGLTVGNDVWIPVYALHGRAALANVLTHELTHVAFNEVGLGGRLPTWINEGTAWMDGLQGQSRVNASSVRLLTQAYNRQLQQVAQSGQLLPLSASEQDILQANYNVEWEDYIAVSRLVQAKGEATLQKFLLRSEREAVALSFQQSFGEPMSTYEQKFVQGLTS